MFMSAFQVTRDLNKSCVDLSQNSLDDKHRTHDNTKPFSNDQVSSPPQEIEVSPFLDRTASHTMLFAKGPTCLREHPDYRHVKWVIFPDDSAKGWWDCLIFLYALFSFLLFCAGVEPYRLAMTDTEDKGPMWTTIDWFVTTIFGLDLILNFFTCYFDDTASLITSRETIAKHYLRTWFAVDLLSCFPFDQFVTLGHISANYGKLARLPRLYRLLKSGKYCPPRLAKLMLDHNSHVLEKAHTLISLAPVFLHFLSFFITVIWCCHVIACLYIFLARMEDFSPDSWVGVLDLDPNDEISLYISGVYYILVTVTTVGYGDISPKSTEEKAFVMLVMVFGIFLYSYTMGTLVSVWKNQHTSKVQFMKRMQVLEDIDREVNMDGFMFNKLKKAIRYDADKSIVHKKKLFEELPTHLRTELIILMNQKLIQSIPFFQPLYIMKADDVYKINDPNDSCNPSSVYFLTKGGVALLGCTLMQIRTVLVKITEGNYFGDLDLLFEEKHTQQAYAEMDCELLALDRPSFFDLCIDFPVVKEELLEAAKARDEVLKETKRIATRMMESSSKMEAKFRFIPSVNYEKADNFLPPPFTTSLDPSSSLGGEYDSFIPDFRRRSYCTLHTVSKHMNSRSKLALRTDARVVNDRQSFEMLAVIGEVERRVEGIDNRMDSWGSRWNEMEGSLYLIGPRKNRPKMKTVGGVYNRKSQEEL